MIHHIEDYGKSTGWGKCIHVIHCVGDTALYESVYAHVDTMLVKRGQLIRRGEQIGTIGDCYGEYYAHLHFELRDSINMGIGVGYSVDTSGYISPKDFINENRPD